MQVMMRCNGTGPTKSWAVAARWNEMQGIGTGTGAKEKATKKRNNGQWESEPRDLPGPKRRDWDHD